MLEFIGVIAVIWIGFKLLRKLYGGAVLDMQVRAIEYATEHSVPRAFAAHMCESPEVIKFAIQTLTRMEPGFAQVKGSEKYGRAIVYLYACHVQAEAKERAQKLAAAKPKLVKFVQPQLDELASGGFHLYINEVAYAYVSALASCMIGSIVRAEQVHELMPAVFKGRVTDRALDDAFRIAHEAERDFSEKLTALLPVAKQELEDGKGAYLVKFIKKVNLAFEEKVSGEPTSWRDISKRTVHQYLGLDA